MLPKLSNILDILEELAPADLAEDWDNPGLQVGQRSQIIQKIMIALDPTLANLKTAHRENAQLLLTHHPLIFTPLTHFDVEIFPANVIFEAMKDRIAIVAAHTNLDVTPGGINDMLALIFELQDATPLQKWGDTKTGDVGLGRIGRLREAKSLDKMGARVKEKLGAQTVKMVGKGDRLINRVAVVGGAGGSLVSLAAEAGADLLITGDVGHHHALEAESYGMALIDGGHFHTEKAALSLFADRFERILMKRGCGATVEFLQEEPGPMRYR